MVLYRMHELINCEGEISSILKDDSDTLYMRGRTDNGKSTIICPTNQFILELYLKSRITLKEVYLISQDQHYFIMHAGQAEARFFEISSDNEPSELKDLTCGDSLYDLLPSGMKSDNSVNEIHGKLPEVKDGIIMSVIDNFETRLSDVQVFSEDSPIQLVQIDSAICNPFESDFLQVTLKTENSSLLCKVNPQLLKLLFTNRITIQELFKAQSDKEYFYFSGKEWYKFFYSTAVEGMIENINYGNLTYYALPNEFQVESVLSIWDSYSRNSVISGHGILPSDFKKEYPVEITINRNKK